MWPIELAVREIEALAHIFERKRITVDISTDEIDLSIQELQKAISIIKKSGGNRYGVLSLEEAEMLMGYLKRYREQI